MQEQDISENIVEQQWIDKESMLDGKQAMQDQDITSYYKNIITLKSGIQIEICTKDYPLSKNPIWKGIHFQPGFVTTPMIVEKTIKFKYDEIAAIESIFEPHIITWKGTQLDPEMADNKHPENCNCQECYKKVNPGAFNSHIIMAKQEQSIAEHKSTCAIHNNPPRGFSSEVTQCDCGAIVRCGDNI